MRQGSPADCARAVFDIVRTQNAKRAEEGFCTGGCLLLLVVAALIIGAVLWGGLSTYQGIYLMTSPGPRTFEPIPSVAAQIAALAKWDAMLQSIRQGGTTEFRFSADDLNAWFFGGGRNADLASRTCSCCQHTSPSLRQARAAAVASPAPSQASRARR